MGGLIIFMNYRTSFDIRIFPLVPFSLSLSLSKIRCSNSAERNTFPFVEMKNHNFANLVIPSAHATACCQDYGIVDCTCDPNSIDFAERPHRSWIRVHFFRLCDLLSVLMCMEIYVIDLLVRQTRSSAFIQDRSLFFFLPPHANVFQAVSRPYGMGWRATVSLNKYHTIINFII